MLFVLFTTPFAFGANGPPDPKTALFFLIMKDPVIQAFVESVRKDPRNPAKVDALLMQLPLSPLDLFQIRMKTSFQEYAVPREIAQWHQRWLRVRPQFVASLQMSEMLVSGTQGASELLMATIGMNRNIASTNTPAPIEYQGEIQLSVNKNNPNQIVAATNTWDVPAGCNQTQAIFSSTNGGANWNYACAPSVAAYGAHCPNSDDLKFGSDPAVFWDSNNKVFVNYMLLCCDIFCQLGFSLPSSALAVARSDNTGASWVAHGLVVNHLCELCGLNDKQFYAIDNHPSSPFFGRHYQCWDIDNNERVAWSNTGTTGSWTVVDLPVAGSGLFDLGCEMAIQSNGTVHLVFDALTCGTSTCSAEKTVYTKSTNGGQTWSSPVLVKQHNIFGFNTSANIPAQDVRGINPFGAIDIDNSGGIFNGRLYVAYSDVDSGASMSTSNIYVARSNDGVNWTQVKVNDDATNTAQFHPFLVVDQTNGSVVVGWHDSRNDPANNRKVDYYISRSMDGGVTWEENTKVSQPSSEFNNSAISYSDLNTTDNSGGNPNQYGEYLGLDAHAGAAYMGWTDTRHYFPNNTNNNQRENIGFAQITFSTSTGDTTPPTTSITSPTAGADVNGTIPVNANASDNTGVTKVEFYLDGTTLIGTDLTPPYSVDWNTTAASNGAHHLTSRAYDAANNTGTSGQINVTVNNPDTTPPITSITAPTAGSSVNGTIQVTATASDNVKVKQVKFYLDGTILLGTDSSSPYKLTWNTNIAPNGSHILTTRATDTSNNTTISQGISVNINNITDCTVTNQIVANPGFESGTTAWGRSSSAGGNSGMITNSPNNLPHSGSWYAHLNGLGIVNTQTLTTSSTTMVIAAEACAASLNFWISIHTTEAGTTANDKVTVQIQTQKPDGTFTSFATIATYSNLDATGMNVYVQKSFNLLPYAGKKVKFRFQGKENSSLQTTILLDDVALNVTQ